MKVNQEAFRHQLDPSPHLARHLAKEPRFWIETQYYSRINEQARIDRLANDPDFLRDPSNHIALYSDHGIVHARDVASQVLQVLDDINGVLIPERSDDRLEFMRAYGVTEAYLHDIGMIDFTSNGREMHAEFATQEVFKPELDDLVNSIWMSDCGGISARLIKLEDDGALEQSAKLVFREMLAMANCHSKSKVSVEVLNIRSALREHMIQSLGLDLRCLHALQQTIKASEELQRLGRSKKDEAAVNVAAITLREAEQQVAEFGECPSPMTAPSKAVSRFHSHFERDAYRWLVSDEPTVIELANDVIDTLRVLRCADALRQRGTVLRTSAGYQVFIERMTANAVYALEHDNGRWFLMEVDNVVAAAEANLASSEFTPEGDVKFTFHRGAFPEAEVVQRAAFNLAVVINDVQEDVIQSFRRPPVAEPDPKTFTKHASEVEILLESIEENLDFAPRIIRELERIDVDVAARTRVVPSLANITVLERGRYLGAGELDWTQEKRSEFIERLAEMGHKTKNIDLENAFRHVRSVQLRRSDTLVEAATPSGFVYIALGEGLQGDPLGGYAAFTVPPYIPIGHIGIIRGAERNSTIRAHGDVEVLVLPREVYLNYWHHTYNLTEITEILRSY